ncbi:MAG: DUF3343 domain-containing protein [Spirochaetaceae bacterium]|jgi:hypothetical protein|nr:DUF3343 domain-containing protein [Spirochaetaceae bacterium]
MARHRELKVESIICFESTSHAIMAEQELRERDFHVRVMPKPSAIEAGCGFCLRFLPKDLEDALKFLSDAGIIIKEIYSMEKTDGRVSYSKSALQPLRGER